MSTKLILFLLIAFVATTSSLAIGQQSAVQFSSGQQRVTLLELYTSEGCSSCPPADEWLSKLKSDERLWRAYVPIALHVDYWDYIGWHDRFASANYSARQQRYAQEGGARFVYTPGFFSNGEDWTGWRYRQPIERQVGNVGELSLRLQDGKLSVRFEPTKTHDRSLTVNVALLGMNLETKVKAGENDGRVLRHDFVLLGMSSSALEESADAYATVTVLPETSQETEELALVAWVSEAGSQAPVQAVGGYLP